MGVSRRYRFAVSKRWPARLSRGVLSLSKSANRTGSTSVPILGEEAWFVTGRQRTGDARCASARGPARQSASLAFRLRGVRHILVVTALVAEECSGEQAAAEQG